MIILSSDDVSAAIDAFNQASAVKDGYGAGTLRKELRSLTASPSHCRRCA